MNPFGSGVIIPLTLLFVGGTGIGAGLTPIFGNSSRKGNEEIILKEEELVTEKERNSHLENKEDFVWEYFLFNSQGVKKCGKSNGKISKLLENKEDCSTEWMKKYLDKKERILNYD